jgi:hypothetical protein
LRQPASPLPTPAFFYAIAFFLSGVAIHTEARVNDLAKVLNPWRSNACYLSSSKLDSASPFALITLQRRQRNFIGKLLALLLAAGA